MGTLFWIRGVAQCLNDGILLYSCYWSNIHSCSSHDYPCCWICRTEEVNYLADHCSSAVNLRLSESGHITADLHMDLPPMRSVLLDPYSGSVCPLSLWDTVHFKGHSKQKSLFYIEHLFLNNILCIKGQLFIMVHLSVTMITIEGTCIYSIRIYLLCAENF